MPEVLVGICSNPLEFEEKYGMTLETLSKRIEERRSEKEFGLKSFLGDEFMTQKD